jgi:hypothetical protein
MELRISDEVLVMVTVLPALVVPPLTSIPS